MIRKYQVTNCRPTHGTVRWSHRTFTETIHLKDNKSIAFLEFSHRIISHEIERGIFSTFNIPSWISKDICNQSLISFFYTFYRTIYSILRKKLLKDFCWTDTRFTSIFCIYDRQKVWSESWMTTHICNKYHIMGIIYTASKVKHRLSTF